MSEFIKVISAAPPLKRVQLLSVVVVAILVFVAFYFIGLEKYKAPDLSKAIVVEGRVSGYPSSWEHNRSLVRVSVSYTLDGKREGKPIYMYRQPFELSGLRINSKVLLTVERLDESSRVVELATEDGRILYEDQLYQQVIEWNNQSIHAKVVFGGIAAAGFCVAILITVLRNRRELFHAD